MRLVENKIGTDDSELQSVRKLCKGGFEVILRFNIIAIGRWFSCVSFVLI